MHDVAIVGAGIAGLAAARALHDAGVRVVVLDKARGAGGRTSTRRAPPHAFDHGAQYFTARDPAFAGAVAEWVAAGAAAAWHGRIAVLRGGTDEDAEPETRYVGTPGMNAPCKLLAQGLDVRFAARVAAVAPEGSGWRLRTDDGADAGRFDGVVVTTPPAQAVPLLTALPDLAARAASVRMLPCWTVMAVLAAPAAARWDGAFVHDSPLGWVAHDGGKPGRPAAGAWVLQATPEWSAEHVDASADEVAAALLHAFAALPGAPRGAAVHAAAHRWLYARTETPLDVPCLVDAPRRVAVAGDWCRGARVEAAWLSGTAAAHALLATLP